MQNRPLSANVLEWFNEHRKFFREYSISEKLSFTEGLDNKVRTITTRPEDLTMHYVATLTSIPNMDYHSSMIFYSGE